MARSQKPQSKALPVADDVPAADGKKSLFDRLAGYLDANDWNCNADEEKKVFTMSVRTRDATVRVILDVVESEDWQAVLALSVFPVYVPEPRRGAVAESICRINYATPYGNLEMDFKDGEIRVRTNVESNGNISDELFARVLHANLGFADRSFAPLAAVAFGNAAPDTVLEMSQRQQESTLQ